jgi:hypothetical protein
MRHQQHKIATAIPGGELHSARLHLRRQHLRHLPR